MTTINERIFVLREAVIRITQMLAGKGIEVTQRGVTAFVRADKDGKPVLVNLPYIPDNATEELLEAIQGFLDHEVAHIMFTDFSKMPEAHKIGAGGMLNLFEDVRIERLMAERFQGSALNLANVGRFFLDKYTKPELEKAIKAGDTDKIKGLLTVPLVRAMGGQSAFKDFMRDHMHHVEDIYDKIKDLEPKILGMRTNEDAFNLAKTTVERLRDGAPAVPEPAMPSMSGSGGGGGIKGGSGKGMGASMGAGDEEEPKPLTPPEDEEEEEPAAAPAPASADPEDEDENEEGESEDSDEEGQANEVDITGSESCGSWEEINKETAKDYDTAVSDVITGGAVDIAKVSDYIIYTKDWDVVEPLKIGSGYKPEMLSRMEDDVLHMVGPLQKDLERAISARSLKAWSPGKRSGRVNPASLHRLATNDDRVFRTRTEVTTKDVAVELVVDMSGSMDGTKINTAARAAYALAMVLERIGIPCEVICFTTGQIGGGSGVDLEAEQAKIGRRFSRVENLYMPILKGFDERLSTETKKRFAWLPNVADLRNNIDGESVEVAGMRLLKRKETGKVMMVLSDGAPHAQGDYAALQAHLKKTVENLTRTGIKMIGLGIESDAVRKFYPKALVINKVDDLPGVVMKELRTMLLN